MRFFLFYAATASTSDTFSRLFVAYSQWQEFQKCLFFSSFGFSFCQCVQVSGCVCNYQNLLLFSSFHFFSCHPSDLLHSYLICSGACVLSSMNVLLRLPREEWVDFIATKIVGSIALTWVLGITYMLTVTLSVLQLREVLHPDILAKGIRPQVTHLIASYPILYARTKEDS